MAAAAAGTHGGVIPSRCAVVKPREKLCSRRESHFGGTAKPLGVGERRIERLAIDRGGHGDVGRVFHTALDLERADPGRAAALAAPPGRRDRRSTGRAAVRRRRRCRRRCPRRRRRQRRAAARAAPASLTAERLRRAGSACGRPGCSAPGCRCAPRPCSTAGRRPSSRSTGRRGRTPRGPGRAARGRRSHRGRARAPGWRARNPGRRGVRAGRSSACRAACWRAARGPGRRRGRSAREAEVGDDQGVEPGAVGRLQGREGRFELVVFEQDVQGEMDACAEEVGAVDRRQQLGRREVAGEGARAPGVETEVDGVGAGRQGRLQGRRPPGRRQQLGLRPGGGTGRWRGRAQSAIGFHSASRRTRMSPEVGTTSTP